jgi:hypothetical protein
LPYINITFLFHSDSQLISYHTYVCPTTGANIPSIQSFLNLVNIHPLSAFASGQTCFELLFVNLNHQVHRRCPHVWHKLKGLRESRPPMPPATSISCATLFRT